MSTRSKTTSTDAATSADELAIREQHVAERERRLRCEQRALDAKRAEDERMLSERASNDSQLREERESALLEAERCRTEVLQLQQALRIKETSTPSETRTVSPPRRERPLRDHASEYSTFGLREALELIPSFDGTNVPVLHFSRACLRARNIVSPAAEPTLAQLILTKLRGRAFAAVEDEFISSVSELCNRLKDVFGTYRTVDHYRGDLANIFMGPNEHILDFIARVKDLRTAILDTTLDDTPTRSIDRFVTRCFVDGLTPNLRSLVRTPRDDSLNSAFDEAIRAFKRAELDRERYDTRTVRFSDSASYRESRRSPSPAAYRSEERRGGSNYREGSPGRRHDSSNRHDERPADASSYRGERPHKNNKHHSSRNNQHQSSQPHEDHRGSQHGNRDRNHSPYRDQNSKSNTGRAYPVADYPSTESPQITPREQYRDNVMCRYCKQIGHDIHECRRREAANARSGNASSLPSGQ